MQLRLFLPAGCALMLACLAGPCAAQSAPNLQQLLQELASPDMHTRALAFEKIKAIPHADTRPDVQRAFVQLLQTENGVIEANDIAQRGGGTDGEYGEDYFEYVAEVGEEVFQYAKLTGSEDPATLAAILRQPQNPHTGVAKWLATRSGLKTSVVIQMAQSRDATSRAQAEAQLVDTLLAAREGRRTMSEQEKTAAKAAVVAGLKDPAPYTRQQAVQSITELRDPSDTALLQTVAANDQDKIVRDQARTSAAWLAKQPPVPHQ